MKKKILYCFTTCKRSGPINVMYNIIANLNLDEYEPAIVTVYDETNRSRIEDFKELGIQLYKIPMSRLDLVLNRTQRLEEFVRNFQPDVIHCCGVILDYALSRIDARHQIITIHNFMYEDFVTTYNEFLGKFLIHIHKKAIKKAHVTVTCSASLSNLYWERDHIEFQYIQNGIDDCKFKKLTSDSDKAALRKKLGLPENKKIFIYTASFTAIKNQKFLTDIFASEEATKNKTLLLLGNGEFYEELRNKYRNSKNIVFAGRKANVTEYLQASDYFISSSKSEGLPMAVLEGMSCGLPVVLTDILQHREVLQYEKNCGLTYELGNREDCVCKIQQICDKNWNYAQSSEAASRTIQNHFTARIMSRKYQDQYKKIIEDAK